MTMTDKPVDNGVNVDALLEARGVLSGAPDLADFEFRAVCKWVNGTHSRSEVRSYFGLGEEQEHKATFTFEADHPETFASEDNGATPTEIVLAALGSCLTAGIASVAQHREIQLHSVTATVRASLDAHGVLGMDPEVRNGFNDIRVHFDINADATQAELDALVAQSQKRSAVFDALSNPTKMSVDVN